MKEKTVEQYKEVRLETINNGAAQELFAEEIRKVLANINDISVEADAVREITIKFKIKPSKDRSLAVTTIEAYSKLAHVNPHEGSIFLSFRENTPRAYLNNVKQTSLNFEATKEGE